MAHKSENYVQCKLFHPVSEQIHTAWIPQKFAVKNKYIKIEDVDGWQVQEVYSLCPREEIIHNHKRLREMTDIPRDGSREPILKMSR